jgi:hypothetical protein
MDDGKRRRTWDDVMTDGSPPCGLGRPPSARTMGIHLRASAIEEFRVFHRR